MGSDIDPLVAAAIVATQEVVDEARHNLERAVDRRNRVFALASAQGVTPTAIAALTGMTRQAVWKAMREGE